MSNTLNGSSPFPGNSWNIYNAVNVIGPLNNKMVIYGNASPSAINLGSNIDASGNLYSNGNLKLPYGTTANRPIPAQGFFRFNTSQTLIEYYNGNTWLNLVNSLTPPTAPTITITDPSGNATTYTWNSSFSTYNFSFVNTNSSTYTIKVTGPCTGLFTLNGAGGGGGNQNAPVTPSAGASGGKTIGTFVMTPGNIYYLLVGQGGTSVSPETTNTIVPIGGGGLTARLGYAGQGGGFTGLFLGPIILGSATTTSVTAGNNSNAIMMAGGGGGGAAEDGGTTIGGQGGGIVGGNAAPQSAPGTEPGGGGGTWNGIGTASGAGGAAYGQLYPPPAPQVGPASLPGVAMQGGIPANSGDYGGGGGGGGGYYGGGGGTGENTPSGTGGGGGAGFFSTAVESPTTTTGTGAAGGPGRTNGTNGSATLAFVN